MGRGKYMDKKQDVSRRQFFQKTMLVTGGVAGMVINKTGLGAVCGLTPSQTEGPFYPEVEPDRDNDLTNIKTGAPIAAGRVLYIEGVVSDIQCNPVRDAVVEIWQASNRGRYNHTGDKNNPSPLDPNFQYWGRMVTNSEGKYWFKTILPGDYQASATWTRTPHIHYKALRRGFRDLTTQLYFSGLTLSESVEQDRELKARLTRLNSRDLILQNLNAEEQKKVVAPLSYIKTNAPSDSLRCQFDIALVSVAG